MNLKESNLLTALQIHFVHMIVLNINDTLKYLTREKLIESKKCIKTTINCQNIDGGAGCVAGEYEGGAAPLVSI